MVHPEIQADGDFTSLTCSFQGHSKCWHARQLEGGKSVKEHARTVLRAAPKGDTHPCFPFHTDCNSVTWPYLQWTELSPSPNSSVEFCLSLFGILQQTTMGWMAHKQQKFILSTKHPFIHSCLSVLEAMKSKIKSPTDMVSIESLLPGSMYMVLFFLCPHMEKWVRGSLSYKSSKPLYEGKLSWATYLPEATSKHHYIED